MSLQLVCLAMSSMKQPHYKPVGNIILKQDHLKSFAREANRQLHCRGILFLLNSFSWLRRCPNITHHTHWDAIPVCTTMASLGPASFTKPLLSNTNPGVIRSLWDQQAEPVLFPEGQYFLPTVFISMF